MNMNCGKTLNCGRGGAQHADNRSRHRLQKCWPRYMILFYPFLCLSIFNFQLTILSPNFLCLCYASMQKISAVRISHAALTYPISLNQGNPDASDKRGSHRNVEDLEGLRPSAADRAYKKGVWSDC